MKKNWITMILFLVLVLAVFSCCKSPTDPGGDPCDPKIGEVVMINVVFDYYRTKVINPNAADAAYIIGSFTDYSSKPMMKVGQDHFQYTCTLQANSYPKTYPYYVGVDDPKRRSGSTLTVSEKITANGTELITDKWMSDGPYKIFWLSKCAVITK